MENNSEILMFKLVASITVYVPFKICPKYVSAVEEWVCRV